MLAESCRCRSDQLNVLSCNLFCLKLYDLGFTDMYCTHAVRCMCGAALKRDCKLAFYQQMLCRSFFFLYWGSKREEVGKCLDVLLQPGLKHIQ